MTRAATAVVRAVVVVAALVPAAACGRRDPPATPRDATLRVLIGGEHRGCAVLVDDDGLAVTADHVVGEAESVTIRFPDGSESEAEVVERGKGDDLALLRVEDTNGHRPPRLATADPAKGAAILGVTGMAGATVTDWSGSVLSERKYARFDPDVWDYCWAIDYEPTPVPGDSGSPMMSPTGELVGVAHGMQRENERSWGCMLPASMVTRRVAAAETGCAPVGSLRARYATLQELRDLGADLDGFPQSGQGVLIAAMPHPTPLYGTPFEWPGGALITRVESCSIRTVEDMVKAVSSTPPGVELELEYLLRGIPRAQRSVLRVSSALDASRRKELAFTFKVERK